MTAPETRRASVEYAQEYAQIVPAKYLRCRVRGHDPVPYLAHEVEDIEGHPEAVWEVFLRCAHGCRVYIRELADARGKLIWSSGLRYDKSEGYLSEEGRILGEAKDHLRLQTYMNFIQTKQQKKG